VPSDTEADGRHFQEMHSDGVSTAQILMLPQALLTSGDPVVVRIRQKVSFSIDVKPALVRGRPLA